jgi:hypothetical protein
MNGHPIGTRVRLISQRHPEHYYGIAPGPGRSIGDTGTVSAHVCAVATDVGVRWDDGVLSGVQPYMIEPIRDDWDTDATPNAVASWTGGVWTPHRERV